MLPNDATPPSQQEVPPISAPPNPPAGGRSALIPLPGLALGSLWTLHRTLQSSLRDSTNNSGSNIHISITRSISQPDLESGQPSFQQQEQAQQSNQQAASPSGAAPAVAVAEAQESDQQTTTSIDFGAVARWLENTFVYLLLLLFLFLYIHRSGIFLWIWLTSVLVGANNLIVKQFSLGEARQALPLLWISILLCFHIYFLYNVLPTSSYLVRPLLLLPPSPPTHAFFHALWVVAINDTLVRFASMSLKALHILAFPSMQKRRREKYSIFRGVISGQIFSVLESLTNLYRSVLPVPVWFIFFVQEGHGPVLSFLLAGLYLAAKCTPFLSRFQRLRVAASALISQASPYGRPATTEDLEKSGDTCAVCQEKMRGPVALQCNHIFCEDCISEWFERNQTCPLCRAVIQNAGQRSHSDGSTSLPIMLF